MRTFAYHFLYLLFTLPLAAIPGSALSHPSSFTPVFSPHPPELLIGLRARIAAAGVALEWEWKYEAQPWQSMRVERRNAASLWEVVHLGKAAGGATYFDSAPLKGNNHYRVIVEGVDGQLFQSNIVSIHYAPVGLVLFPNPAQEYIQLSHNSPAAGNAKIDILDLDGKKIKSYKRQLEAGANALSLDITALPVGHYLLRFRDVAGQHASLTFVKYD